MPRGESRESTGKAMTLVMQSLELLKKEARVFTELGRNLSCCLGEILLGRLLQWHEVSRTSFISLLAANQFDVKTPHFTVTRTLRPTSWSVLGSEWAVLFDNQAPCQDPPAPYFCSGCPGPVKELGSKFHKVFQISNLPSAT